MILSNSRSSPLKATGFLPSLDPFQICFSAALAVASCRETKSYWPYLNTLPRHSWNRMWNTLCRTTTNTAGSITTAPASGHCFWHHPRAKPTVLNKRHWFWFCFWTLPQSLPPHKQNMDQTQHEKETSGRQRVIQSILEAGSKAFDPRKPESSRAQAVRDFDDVIQRQARQPVICVRPASDRFPGPRLSISSRR
jgi:hypothetical protein